MNQNFTEISYEKLLEILSTTIKDDNENKVITFLGMLSAFTEDSQLNISLNAPSSAGKTYIPMQVARYFPKEDLKILAGASPTAFIHETGEQGENKNERIINLERKIIIFQDQPHNLTLALLRPLLSHDDKVIEYKVTDKSGGGGLKTKTAKLVGFAVVIFCSAGMSLDEQEATRFMLLSPDLSQEKLRHSIAQKITKESNTIKFEEELEMNVDRSALKERVLEVKTAAIKNIIIHNDTKIRTLFLSEDKVTRPRDQRDAPRVIAIAKCWALLNFRNRDLNEQTITTNDIDIEIAIKLWEFLGPSQEYNLSPFVWRVYKTVIKPLIEKNLYEETIGITRAAIMKEYYRLNNNPLQEYQLRQQILPQLENVGLVVSDKIGNTLYYKLPSE